jgi:hypothetical protein
MSVKSVKGWTNERSKIGKDSPEKNLNAVYLHTKNDMESLERYMNMNDDVIRSERKSRTPLAQSRRNENTH